MDLGAVGSATLSRTTLKCWKYKKKVTDSVWIVSWYMCSLDDLTFIDSNIIDFNHLHTKKSFQILVCFVRFSQFRVVCLNAHFRDDQLEDSNDQLLSIRTWVPNSTDTEPLPQTARKFRCRRCIVSCGSWKKGTKDGTIHESIHPSLIYIYIYKMQSMASQFTIHNKTNEPRVSEVNN